MSYARSGARSQSAPDTDWMPSGQGRSNRISYRPRDNAHRCSLVRTTEALQQVPLTRPREHSKIFNNGKGATPFGRICHCEERLRHHYQQLHCAKDPRHP
eukprot:scaffold1263_cov302-Pinguiococcus_pyrenoidosus.AAC.2